MPRRPLPELDADVVRAMARWPDVPQCFGWLSLDRRGRWRIRDEVIAHPRAVAFLGRNYRDDEHGRWYVQNGPQQVFVTLEYTPWIVRFDVHGGFTTHTGLAFGPLDTAHADDDGNVLVAGTLGIGLVDDRDLAALSTLIEHSDDGPPVLGWEGRRLPLAAVRRAEVPQRFGFDPAPAAP
jgi:hypothetical protein